MALATDRDGAQHSGTHVRHVVSPVTGQSYAKSQREKKSATKTSDIRETTEVLRETERDQQRKRSNSRKRCDKGRRTDEIQTESEDDGTLEFNDVHVTIPDICLNAIQRQEVYTTLKVVCPERAGQHHLRLKVDTGSGPGGGGSHIGMVYVYVPAFWGTFSRNLV